MFCQYCGKKNNDDAVFCQGCGERQSRSQSSRQTDHPFYAATKQTKSNEPTKNVAAALSLCLGIVLLVALAIGFIIQNQPSNYTHTDSNISLIGNSNFIETSRVESVGLMNPSAFTVRAGGYVYKNFTIGKGRTARVVGDFTASGGSGDDIEVSITDERGFANFKNNHSYDVWYNSEKTTSGAINLSLAEGKYVIIFSNTYSIMTPKAITSNIILEQ